MAGLATALRIAPHSSPRIALVTKDVPLLSARPRGRRIAVDRAVVLPELSGVVPIATPPESHLLARSASP
jgi:hypothetical protein